MTLLLLCIPAALLAGLLWGVALEKHREARRRDKMRFWMKNGSVEGWRQPDDPKRRSF